MLVMDSSGSSDFYLLCLISNGIRFEFDLIVNAGIMTHIKSDIIFCIHSSNV